MKISLILPTYNRADILKTCLKYLERQDYPPEDFEVIVVDNNSSDDTRSVVEIFKQQHPYLSVNYVFEKQQGLVYARHAGARSAKYDILSYIDDDGFLNPSWLHEIARVFQTNEQVAAVAGKIIIKWDTTPPEWIGPYEWLLGRLNYGDEVRYEHNLYVNGGSFSIKKDILFELGGFEHGQKGDFLVGNSEDGLNDRLWQAGYLIGYTPYAVMEHYQLVGKNGTESDIRRRYKNLGFRIPYQIFAIEKKGCSGLLYNLLKRIKGITLGTIKWMHFSLKKKTDDARHTRFLITHDWAQVMYTLKIFFSKKFRALLRNKTDYQLSD
jgi:glycosyltransferase involved in cell wall biosynthesis